MRTRSILALAAVVLAGCANPGPVQVSPDKAGVFGNESALVAGVIRDADAFAASKGMVAVPVSSRETPMELGRRLASFEYEFRPVSKNDARARSVVLLPRPDVVVQKSEQITKTDSAHPGLYQQLLQLDELHKQGVLTDAEFAAAKARLLAGH
jgi:uncharacterized protein YcfL